MYFLSRQILLAALLVYLYCGLLVASAFSPISWWILLGLGFLALRNRKKLRGALTAHGTAYWLSSEEEAEQFGMLRGKGLPLGRLIGAAKPGLMAGISGLLSKRKRAKQACLEFIASVRGKKAAPFVRMPPHVVNTVVFAPVGAGKSTGLVIPFLLECEDSCIVIDFKGELAQATALHRKRMGHEIAIFDPYKVVTLKNKKLPFTSASLNGVDIIEKHSMLALEHCRSAANAVVITTGQEKDQHWNQRAEEGICGLLGVTAYYGQANNQSMQDVDRLATNAQQLAMAIDLMQKPDPITGQLPWDGMLARIGGSMQGWSGEERSSIISNMGKNLAFLRTPAIAAVTRTSSFRPQFKRKKQTAYIVCSPEFLRKVSAGCVTCSGPCLPPWSRRAWARANWCTPCSTRRRRCRRISGRSKTRWINIAATGSERNSTTKAPGSFYPAGPRITVLHYSQIPPKSISARRTSRRPISSARCWARQPSCWRSGVTVRTTA